MITYVVAGTAGAHWSTTEGDTLVSKRPFLVLMKLFATCMTGVFVRLAGMICVLNSIWASVILLQQKAPTVVSSKFMMSVCSIAQHSEESLLRIPLAHHLSLSCQDFMHEV